MSKITTIKGSLFDAPKGSIIIHACNCKGTWGSGIAKEFARRFPSARDLYVLHCRENGVKLLGTCLMIDVGSYVIGCLFTSKNYGHFVDPPHKILSSTKSAIAHLIALNEANYQRPMHMCKINSGLFKVPWSDTKKILSESGAEFTVYDY